MKVLTHSRLSTFRACPRRHWIRYELGLSPERDGFALRVGSAFHAALDAFARGEDPAPVLEEALADPYDLALVAAMVAVHAEQYRREPLEIVASELAFELPLWNPATGRASTVWRRAGVIDALARLDDGRLALVERKTTSRDFSPGSDYWLALRMDPQLSTYLSAARELGYGDVDTILYDVTRRPLLRPRRATPEEKRKYKADGQLYANQRAEDEPPEAFAARVAADMRARPEHYFARVEIARLDQDIDDCAAELWQQQKALRRAQRRGHWYRSPGACFAPWPCAYLSVCQNRDLEDVTPNGFIRLDDVHPELATAGG